jgi:hypothetical protein
MWMTTPKRCRSAKHSSSQPLWPHRSDTWRRPVIGIEKAGKTGRFFDQVIDFLLSDTVERASHAHV